MRHQPDSRGMQAAGCALAPSPPPPPPNTHTTKAEGRARAQPGVRARPRDPSAAAAQPGERAALRGHSGASAWAPYAPRAALRMHASRGSLYPYDVRAARSSSARWSVGIVPSVTIHWKHSTREHSTAHLLRRARAASIFSAEVLRRSRSIARGPRQTHSRSARAREREGGAVARSAVAERARGARARRAGASLAPRVAPPVAPDGRALRIIGRDRRGRPRRVPCPRVGGVQRPRRRWATRWPRQSTRRTWPP